MRLPINTIKDFGEAVQKPAVLDELEHFLDKIASFRKSPKPALDEDAIRADERKKVFRDVITLVESYRGHTSKHTVDNILFDLGTIAKGGDEG